MDYRQLKAAAATSGSSAVQEAARKVKEKELKLRQERDKVSRSFEASEAVRGRDSSGSREYFELLG